MALLIVLTLILFIVIIRVMFRLFPAVMSSLKAFGFRGLQAGELMELKDHQVPSGGRE